MARTAARTANVAVRPPLGERLRAWWTARREAAASARLPVRDGLRASAAAPLQAFDRTLVVVVLALVVFGTRDGLLGFDRAARQPQVRRLLAHPLPRRGTRWPPSSEPDRRLRRRPGAGVGVGEARAAGLRGRAGTAGDRAAALRRQGGELSRGAGSRWAS
jgi:hypothetical protein